MRLINKFRLIIALATTGLLLLSGFWLKMERPRILGQKKEKARSLVETAYSVVEHYQQLEAAGTLTRQQAQEQALVVLSSMRYESDNYFWVNDLRPAMIMHPMKPEMKGRDLRDYKDSDGKLMFVEMAEVTQQQGQGFVAYRWPRPGANRPIPKLSFVKGFAAWGWVIGTGIYMDDVDAMWWRSALVAGAVAVPCLLVLLTASAAVARSTFRRLTQTVERLKDVAQGEGDLTRRLEAVSNDEVGELAKWFNTFVDKMYSIIAELADDTHRLATASEEISTSSQQQAHGAQTQEEQIQEVARAMQEMSESVHDVSQNSNAAATTSAKAAETAREGGRVIEDALRQMGAIAESVAEASRRVQDLGARSGQIGEIVGVIDSIADQTNLLALNAAIEAARAGEQGRGFAVVADEVRKLAERTSAATKEISTMIGSIQAETKNAVAAIQAGTTLVEAGVSSTNAAGRSLKGIIEASEDVGNLIVPRQRQWDILRREVKLHI